MWRVVGSESVKLWFDGEMWRCEEDYRYVLCLNG